MEVRRARTPEEGAASASGFVAGFVVASALWIVVIAGIAIGAVLF